MKKNNLENIRTLLCEAFNNSDIPDSVSDLKIGDLAEWDSIGNFNLLLLAEEWFEFKFSMEEMANIKSIPELVAAIKSRNEK
jgi:acyl carrier protein